MIARVTVDPINGCPVQLAASDLGESREELTTETEILVTRADARRMAALSADEDIAVTVVDLLTDRPLRVCGLDSASYLATAHPGLQRP